MGQNVVIWRYVTIISCFLSVTSQDKNSTSAANSTLTIDSIPVQDTTDTTHLSREHMHKVPPKLNASTLPPFEIPEKNDGKQSVGRKGVTEVGSTNASTTSTTVAPPTKPKKPKLTEAEEGLQDIPLTTKNETKNHAGSLDGLIEQEKKTDYVVPIVVVILSVPLVAIIFSILYKRGAEWWQHRHYRRMDFLIEGMYNN